MRRFIALLALAIVGCGTTAKELSLHQMAAKMVIVGVEGTTLEPSNEIIPDIKERGVSGVILFERNIAPEDSRATLSKFIADMKALSDAPLFVSVDQEGGRVNRLKSKYGFAEMPSQQMVASARLSGFPTEIASTIASEVASVGFNINFSPCVDLNVNPDCPVIGKIERSFSDNVERVTELAQRYIDEHNSRGVITALKHFPGHGSSATDSHLGLTDITDSWSREELRPFQNLFDQGYSDMVMVSHLFNSTLDEEYPATLSSNIINGLLRQELGWQGVVVSDDMQMRAITDHYGFEESIIRAINAGVDLFIISRYGNDPEGATRFINVVVDGVRSGKIARERVVEAVERIERLREKI